MTTYVHVPSAQRRRAAVALEAALGRLRYPAWRPRPPAALSPSETARRSVTVNRLAN